MNEQEALVGLNMVSGIGSVKLSHLLKVFSQPENIFKASSTKLRQAAGVGEEIARQISSFNKEDLAREFALVKKYHLKIMAICDKDYPENLKQIPSAPIVLYVKGELRKEDKLAIAVVGSRRASLYGISQAEKFSYDLAEYGFTIVSGLARGIDSASHRGALKAGGRTIAVLGSGFSHIYPAENKKLLEEVAQNGAVISEFPVNTLPLRENFPRRNRVISGLSLGVLVAEAAQNSGALITADFALEQGREVFALPGKVDSQTSFGPHQLIKQGAKLASSIEDILEELEIYLPQRQKKPLGANPEARPGLDAQEEEVYALLPCGSAVQAEEMAEKINLDIPSIFGILLKLQLKKLIRQLPGKQFIRN